MNPVKLHAQVMKDGSTVCPQCMTPSNMWDAKPGGRVCPCGIVWHTSKRSKNNPIKQNWIPYAYMAYGVPKSVDAVVRRLIDEVGTLQKEEQDEVALSIVTTDWFRCEDHPEAPIRFDKAEHFPKSYFPMCTVCNESTYSFIKEGRIKRE